MKVAIVHEMLIKLWGAENVVRDLLEVFPEAKLYALLYDESKTWQHFPKESIIVTKPAQRIYRLLKRPRLCLAWMKQAVESLDMSDYDVVISSNSWFAHGVKTWTKTLHICYYHSPARYLWDATHSVAQELGIQLPVQQSNKDEKKVTKWPLHKSIIWSVFLSRLRQQDILFSKRPDISIANAREVKKRLQKYYRKNDISIIHPGIDVSSFRPSEQEPKNREYYLTGWALTPFKLHDKTIELFNRNGYPLKIFGSGDQCAQLKSIAKDNIEFVGRVSDERLKDLYRHARGFVMMNKEDFGITPIEAMASGTPVFAYDQGGARETIIDGETWLLFDTHTMEGLVSNFELFHACIENGQYTIQNLTTRAQIFSKNAFTDKMRQLVIENLSYSP